jgi:hypothetical protein
MEEEYLYKQQVVAVCCIWIVAGKESVFSKGEERVFSKGKGKCVQ